MQISSADSVPLSKRKKWVLVTYCQNNDENDGDNDDDLGNNETDATTINERSSVFESDFSTSDSNE